MARHNRNKTKKRNKKRRITLREDGTRASQVALNTFDIVSNIIEHLPKTDIARVAMTSRIWRNVVAETPSIRNRPALEPAKVHTNTKTIAQKAEDTMLSTMVYRPEDLPCKFQFDEHLKGTVLKEGFGRRWLTTHTAKIPTNDSENDLRNTIYDRYACWPPCQALGLLYWRRDLRREDSDEENSDEEDSVDEDSDGEHSGEDESDEDESDGEEAAEDYRARFLREEDDDIIECIVYVKSGVKLGHLLDAAQGMWQSDYNYVWKEKDGVPSPDITSSVEFGQRGGVLLDKCLRRRAGLL